MSEETILIVDDEPAIVSFMGTVLRGRGYAVREATDGSAALHQATRCPGPIHLLLTDLHMPGMPGTQLFQRLRSRHPEAQCLLVSGDIEAIETSGLPFLGKPFRAPELVQRVRQVLETSLDQLAVVGRDAPEHFRG